MSFNSLFGLGSHSEDADLHGWWPLQDDAASTTVDDASSNANDGTLTGGDDTSDISGTGPNSWLAKALHFDGSADYIDVSPGSLGADDATLLLWLKADSDPAASAGASGFGVLGEHHTIASHYPWTDGNVHCATWRSSDAFTTSRVTVGNPSPSLTSWREVCVKSESGASGWKFRIDQSNIGTATGHSTLYTGSGDWWIGRSNNGSSNYYYDGLVAGVSIFSRHLSDSEEAEAFAGPEPVNSVAPAVTGTEEEDETLSCTSGTWGLDSPFSSGSNGTITYAYQWTRSNDGSGTGEADISGATSSTYTLVAADVGKYIRCRVSASNDGGNDSDADTESNFTGAISGSAISITPADAGHSHAVDAPVTTQTHAITPAAAGHAHASDVAAVSPSHAVVAEDSLHGHAVDSPTSTQTHAIAPIDAGHSHVADTGTVTQSHAVTPSDADHAHTADGVAVTQTHVIGPAVAVHSHVTDSPTVSQELTVTSDSTLHSHAADASLVTYPGAVVPSSAFHSHNSDATTYALVVGAVLEGWPVRGYDVRNWATRGSLLEGVALGPESREWQSKGQGV